MGDFSRGWLALREPADTRARSARHVQRLAAWLTKRAGPAGDSAAPLDLVDLGCGTGSNLRYLAPRLGRHPGGRQRWCCLDGDGDLLAALPLQSAEWALRLGMNTSRHGDGLQIQGPGGSWEIHLQQCDLACIENIPIGRGTLVVASGLLDLVSESWLEGLMRACSRARAPLLLALTYDGRVDIEPEHPLDQRVIGLVNAHQRGEKGFGPALGPTASFRLAELAEPMGFAADLVKSDWRLAPDETGLQLALTEGWAAAALEQLGECGATDARILETSIEHWLETRRAEIHARSLHIRVGHRDALLLPR